MKPLWFVRRYRDGDEYGIARLFKESEGLDEDYLRKVWVWKHKKCPIRHLTMVAVHDKQIVGHMSAIHLDMKVNNEAIVGSIVVDLIVHPSFRRHGIFGALNEKLINEERREKVPILYTFPNALSHPGFLKYGWFDICDVPRFVKFFNVHDALSAHLTTKYRMIKLVSAHKGLSLVMRFCLYIATIFVNLFLKMFARENKHFNLEGIKIIPIKRFDYRIDDFWKEVSRYYCTITARNSSYLNWLYFEKPNSRYKVFIAETSGKVLAYIVLLISNSGSGRIVDILTYPNKSIIQLLLSKALDYFKREKAKWVTCSIIGNNLFYKVLRENGFVPFTSEGPLTVMINSSRISKSLVKEAKNWYVAYGT